MRKLKKLKKQISLLYLEQLVIDILIYNINVFSMIKKMKMKEREYTVKIKDIQNRINHLKKEINNKHFDMVEIEIKKNKLKLSYDKRDEAFRNDFTVKIGILSHR